MPSSSAEIAGPLGALFIRWVMWALLVPREQQSCCLGNSFQTLPRWSLQLCSSKQHPVKGSGTCSSSPGRDGAWWKL